jgi:hypothetical protein
MKRIKIITADGTLLAKPLCLSQLEEFESTINEIGAEAVKLSASGADVFPVTLLRKQASIVLSALQSHDKAIDPVTIDGLSITEISQAYAAVVSGSGLEEIEPGETKAGQ